MNNYFLNRLNRNCCDGMYKQKNKEPFFKEYFTLVHDIIYVCIKIVYRHLLYLLFVNIFIFQTNFILMIDKDPFGFPKSKKKTKKIIIYFLILQNSN